MTPERPATFSVLELSELAGGLAHEIRNPLSTLKVNLQLLVEDLREERDGLDISADFKRRALQRLEILRGESQRLQTLLDDFLKVVSSQTLETQRHDLNALVEEIAAFFRPQAASQNIILTVERSPSALPCRLDADLFKQAVINLVVNGMQAMPEGGSLALRTAARAGAVELAIEDSGGGIHPDVADRIFAPFFSTKKNGTGLGLSMTRRIVTELGGTITAGTAPGGGARFAIVLPAAEG